jgi:hypothetical protein
MSNSRAKRLNKTWSTISNTTSLTQSQHGTLWPPLTIRRNQISQPGLNVILTKSTAQTTKPECWQNEQFQAPGRSEQWRGRGVTRFTRRRSIISLLCSYVRGSRLNTAQYSHLLPCLHPLRHVTSRSLNFNLIFSLWMRKTRSRNVQLG